MFVGLSGLAGQEEIRALLNSFVILHLNLHGE